MLTRMTVRLRDGQTRDVEVRAPVGATVADIASTIAGAVGVRADAHDGLRIWAGSRVLDNDVLVGAPGLRSGCVLGLGTPTARVSKANAAVGLHVVGGPDAGRVSTIDRGRTLIGRDPKCEIRLTDPDVSREHAELTVSSSAITVRDLGSTNGTRILSAREGPLVVRGAAEPVGLDTYISVGDTILCVAGIKSPPVAFEPADDGRLLVNRPPRVVDQPIARLELPPPTDVPRRAAVPWVAALLPAVGGVGLAWFLHSPQFLAFALLSPVVLLATSLTDRLGGRRGRRHARVATRNRHAAEREAITSLVEHETEARRRAHPDPAALFTTATTPDARLWERRRSDADFLDVRLGLGNASATTTVRRGSDPVALPELLAVPTVVSLRAGPLGICGPRQLALPLARWVIGQLVVLHSPSDLHVVALLPDDCVEGDWAWLRWLPHLRDGRSFEPRIARSPDERQAAIGALTLPPASRSDDPSRANPTALPARGATVVLVDRCSALPDLGGLREILSRPDACVTAVFLEDEPRRLPATCVTSACLVGESGSHIRVRSHRTVREEPGPTPPPELRVHPSAREPVADRVTAQWCDRAARSLAPLNDSGSDQARDLPIDVRARDLFQLQDLEPDTLRTRWATAKGRPRTPLAVGVDGPVEIDLARDGPHALIAGTTGAGKSELLQSLVTGLAVHSSPSDLQFVLIDYKGGAAFAECAGLPHTVGLVTDLDTHLTERALRSLDAELRWREVQFARAGAADLAAYRASTVNADEPMGRLILVVDEFAALAEELPGFVTGLIGIAQRGRSLGVHLILATQRPGGVVSAEIRANTALRIALRVTDPAESSDVVGSDRAARIDPHRPGRALMRTGHTVAEIQIGRIAVASIDTAERVQVVPLDAWGRPCAAYVAPTTDRQTDLQTIVAALRRAARGRPTPRRPWLDPLPEFLELGVDPPIKSAATIVLGRTDRPAEQRQTPFLLDLDEPSTMLFAGGPRTGRTSLLRAAAVTAANQLGVGSLHVYAVDCAGGRLRTLERLPHCGAVVGPDGPSSIVALIDRLARELDLRQRRAAERGPGLATPDMVPSAAQEPAILVLLDGWEGFLAAVEDLDVGKTVDTFLHLVRDGTSAGFTVLITGDRAALAARLSSSVGRRYVFRLSDPTDYAIAGLTRAQVPTHMPPGRLVDTADGTETHVGTIGRAESPAAHEQVLQHIVDQIAARSCEPSATKPFTVRALPPRVRLNDIRSSRRSGQVVLGVGGDAAEPLPIALAPLSASSALTNAAPTAHLGIQFLVAGPPRSGRSTLLCVVLAQLREEHGRIIVAAGRRSPLADAAQARGIPVVGPASDSAETADADHRRFDTVPAGTGTRDRGWLEALLDVDRPTILLVDDCELFSETQIGDRLGALVRSAPPGLNALVAGRTDDLAMSFRGVGAEVKRSRTGVLLQPGPGDGDLFGIRLPYQRATMPAGRGLLVAPDLVPDGTGTGPLALQVALP